MMPTTANYKTPNSRLVLRADATREEWLAERRRGIGGSDASTILGLNKYASAYGLWLEKTGRSKDERTASEAMYWGTALEPILRRRFVEDTGIAVRSAGLHRSKSHPFMQVSLDGICADGGIFESKTASSWAAGDDWDDDGIPDHAALQVQHGLAVTGRSHAWIVGLLDGRNWQIRGPIPRNEELIETIVAAEARFWNDYVLADVEPPVSALSNDELKDHYRDEDPGKAVVISPEVLEPLKVRIESARALGKTAERSLKEAEAELRRLAGDAELILPDEFADPVATLRSTANMSVSRLREDKPEIVEKYTKPMPKFDLDTFKVNEPELYTAYRSRVLRFTAPKKKK